MTDIQKRLFELQDHAYGDFHSGLIPELPREYFIGVRVPVLKKFVKELAAQVPMGSNMRGSAAYRTHLAEVLIRRALERITNGGEKNAD